MKISEIAQRAGVSKHTVRYYEQLGMINHGVKPAGMRSYGEYDTSALETIILIKGLQGLGFTLRELKDYMHEYRFIKNNEAEIHRVMKNKIRELKQKRMLLDETINIMEYRVKHGRYPDDKPQLKVR